MSEQPPPAYQNGLTLILETKSGPVSVAVRRSRRRTLQLSIDREGAVTFKIPLGASQERLRSLLDSKADWIARTRRRVMNRLPTVRGAPFGDGASFFVLGRPRTLRVAGGDLDWLRFYARPEGWQAVVPERFDIKEKEASLKKALELWFRRKAEEYLPLRLDLWSNKMGLARPKISIKRHKWLWGSCNKYRRTVNLNWKIISFPVEIIDYVIIHELCHLQVADHSRKFWGEVARWCPEWKKLRRWLREEAYRHAMP